MAPAEEPMETAAGLPVAAEVLVQQKVASDQQKPDMVENTSRQDSSPVKPRHQRVSERVSKNRGATKMGGASRSYRKLLGETSTEPEPPASPHAEILALRSRAYVCLDDANLDPAPPADLSKSDPAALDSEVCTDTLEDNAPVVLGKASEEQDFDQEAPQIFPKSLADEVANEQYFRKEHAKADKAAASVSAPSGPVIPQKQLSCGIEPVVESVSQSVNSPDVPAASSGRRPPALNDLDQENEDLERGLSHDDGSPIYLDSTPMLQAPPKWEPWRLLRRVGSKLRCCLCRCRQKNKEPVWHEGMGKWVQPLE